MGRRSLQTRHLHQDQNQCSHRCLQQGAQGKNQMQMKASRGGAWAIWHPIQVLAKTSNPQETLRKRSCCQRLISRKLGCNVVTRFLANSYDKKIVILMS